MRDMEMETTGNACEPFTTPRGRRWEPYSNLSFILGEECGFGKGSLSWEFVDSVFDIRANVAFVGFQTLLI